MLQVCTKFNGHVRYYNFGVSFTNYKQHERSAKASEYERAVKNKNTLTDLRKNDRELKEAIEDSMAAPMTLIGQCFQNQGELH